MVASYTVKVDAPTLLAELRFRSSLRNVKNALHWRGVPVAECKERLLTNASASSDAGPQIMPRESSVIGACSSTALLLECDQIKIQDRDVFQAPPSLIAS